MQVQLRDGFRCRVSGYADNLRAAEALASFPTPTPTGIHTERGVGIDKDALKKVRGLREAHVLPFAQRPQVSSQSA